MLHADRNGFFYVFDRRDGTLLLAKQFVKYLTWSSGIGPDGRPIKLPGQEPTPAGTKVCPSQDGATNWFSPSFNPATSLYYVQTFEKCSLYTKSDSGDWEPGKAYLGGSQRTTPDPAPQRILKAINIFTGDIAWTLPEPGPANSWGGTLTTASGLVIFGDELFAIEHVGHRRRFPGLIGLKPPQWVAVRRIRRDQASALLAKNHQAAGSGERAAPRVGGSWLRQRPSNVARKDIYRFQNPLRRGVRCSTLRPAQVSLPWLPISRIALCVEAAFFKSLDIIEAGCGIKRGGEPIRRPILRWAHFRARGGGFLARKLDGSPVGSDP